MLFRSVNNDVATSSVEVRETSRTTSRLGVNLQIAKRWYHAGLRFGLFESTGGVAADFYLFRDRFRASVEAFEWRGQGNSVRRIAHLKAYASILFFEHVYTMIGIDDPTRLDPATNRVNAAQNYFVGAGVSFNDQDLKALFGAAALAK